MTSGPCWFSSKELFQKKVRMVLEKRKSFMQKKVVQKGACVDYA
jgi:hypothetical protein